MLELLDCNSKPVQVDVIKSPKSLIFGFNPSRDLPIGPLDQSILDAIEDIGVPYKQWITILVAFNEADATYVKDNTELFTK